MDTKGAGKVTLTVSQIQDLLQVSRITAWRYYTSTLLFNKVIKRGELVTLYYKGIVPLCIELGISHWGASAEINIKDLRRIKYFSTLAETLSLQARAKYLANLNVKKEARERLNKKKAPKGSFTPALSDNKIDAIFTSDLKSVSEISTGIMKLEYGTLFVNQSWTPFGASQSGVAFKLKRSLRTINRRLQLANKVKVALTDNQIAHEYNYYKFIDSEEFSNLSGKYFINNGSVFKRQPSLYQPILALTTKKAGLNRLKSRLTASLVA
jgi:hypothetical protein